MPALWISHPAAWAEKVSTMGDEARILIVCTGNICRSPFIERLLQRRLDDARPGSRRAVLVSSAGTSAMTGWDMDPQSAAQLVAVGGDPSDFTARALTPVQIAESDLVLTATRVHLGQVAAMYPKALRRVFAFNDFAHLVAELPDPVAGAEGPGSPVIQTDPRARIRQVVEVAAASRGLKPPLAPAQADILDPFRRKDEVFATMAQQIVESMPAIVRALVG